MRFDRVVLWRFWPNGVGSAAGDTALQMGPAPPPGDARTVEVSVPFKSTIADRPEGDRGPQLRAVTDFGGDAFGNLQDLVAAAAA
jgi:hypothetical protein